MRGIYDRGKQLYSKGRKRTIAYSTASETAFVGMSSLKLCRDAELAARLPFRFREERPAEASRHN